MVSLVSLKINGGVAVCIDQVERPWLLDLAGTQPMLDALVATHSRRGVLGLSGVRKLSPVYGLNPSPRPSLRNSRLF